MLLFQNARLVHLVIVIIQEILLVNQHALLEELPSSIMMLVRVVVNVHKILVYGMLIAILALPMDAATRTLAQLMVFMECAYVQMLLQEVLNV